VDIIKAESFEKYSGLRNLVLGITVPLTVYIIILYLSKSSQAIVVDADILYPWLRLGSLQEETD